MRTPKAKDVFVYGYSSILWMRMDEERRDYPRKDLEKNFRNDLRNS